jgi:hypothetical protein
VDGKGDAFLKAANVPVCRKAPLALLLLGAGWISPVAGQSQPAEDPFAGVREAVAPAGTPPAAHSWAGRFFSENFGFRKEIMSQFDITQDGRGASRQSVGFEVLKKFSTATSTFAGFNFQGRLVRRDGYNPVLNDMEGAARPGWAFEYHNLYLEIYNPFQPLMGDEARARNAGRFNFRIGRFYVPFGLNVQTDTHGTVLQLSNESNFGFERDWQTGFRGTLNRHLNYDAYYLAGSGYDLKFRGQSGLAAVRVSLSNRYSSRYGLEGGVSGIAGERLSARMGGEHAGATAADLLPLKTQRVGIDVRHRRTAPDGLLTFTTEMSGGRDASDPVLAQLHEAEYLHSSRRWGVAAQFRRFSRDGFGVNSSVIGEFSWYFRNDAGNSNSHWIKLNIERQLQSYLGPPHTIVTLQYYFYR